MNWLFLGALGGALAVIAGAFGAHVLAGRLQPHELDLWDKAARYLMYGSLALVMVGLARLHGLLRGIDAAGWCLLLGSAIFSGTLFGLALGGPRLLGAVTPLGGLLIIAGFLFFAWAALKP